MLELASLFYYFGEKIYINQIQKNSKINGRLLNAKKIKMDKEIKLASIRCVKENERRIIDEIVSIHLKTFPGFFLSFMGHGFLKQMYCSYCEHVSSGVLVAEENDKVVGFLAYSSDYSGLYKYMIRRHLCLFAWYSMGAFIRRPSAFMHIIKAFLKPREVKRKEEYVELSSIGVDPDFKSKGVGTQLIDKLKEIVDFSRYKYITLETDAVDNEVAIKFYKKNNFVVERMYETSEKRKMYEFRYRYN